MRQDHFKQRRWLGWSACGLLAAMPLWAFVSNYNERGQHQYWFKPGSSGFVSPNVMQYTSRTIKYYLDPNGFSEAGKQRELDAIRTAFDQWQQIPDSRLHFEEAGFVSGKPEVNLFDNTNTIFWEKESFLVNGGLDDIRGSLGLTFRAFFDDFNLVEADIVFNGLERQWTTDYVSPAFNAIFVEAVALHEIGHLIGMEHATIGSSTMMWQARPGLNSQLDLSADDIAFVQTYYPADGLSDKLGTLQGQVELGGEGVLGAVVLLEDTQGNLIRGTISHPVNQQWQQGFYQMTAVPPGDYLVRVCPLDHHLASQFLINGPVIDYFRFPEPTTDFQPSEPVAISIQARKTTEQRLSLQPGSAAFRILGIQPRVRDLSLLTLERSTAQITQGDQDIWVGFYGENLPSEGDGVVVGIRGSGIETKIKQYRESLFGDLDAWLIQLSVETDALPGPRSFFIQDQDGIAYANGFLHVEPRLPDTNQDGLNDTFQRSHFAHWTGEQAAPSQDPDGDRYTNLEEYQAGSVPTQASSTPISVLPPFSLLEVEVSQDGASILFESQPGQRYQLHGRHDAAEGPWTVRGEPVTAEGPTTQILDPSTTELNTFYRVEVLSR